MEEVTNIIVEVMVARAVQAAALVAAAMAMPITATTIGQMAVMQHMAAVAAVHDIMTKALLPKEAFMVVTAVIACDRHKLVSKCRAVDLLAVAAVIKPKVVKGEQHIEQMRCLIAR